MIGIGVFGDDYEQQAAAGSLKSLSSDSVIAKLQGSHFAGMLHTKNPDEIEKFVQEKHGSANLDHSQVIALTKALITKFDEEN